MLVLVGSCQVAPSATWTQDAPETPTVFAPGVISGDDRDYDIAFTPDGLEAYFTRRGQRGSPRLLVSRYSEAGWTAPEAVPFASDSDEAPFVTPEGDALYFVSQRALPGTRDRSDNIWRVLRGQEGWDEPAPIAGTVNQPEDEVDDYDVGDELSPILLGDGSLLYSTRVDPEWGYDLYVATQDEAGSFTDPRPLRINTYGDETSPAVSPDGLFLVFQAYRDANGIGDQDLYVSERTEWGWSNPVPLPEPINSPRSDGYPSFSPDGKVFFFASDRNARGGYYDIFHVDVAALGLTR